MTTIIITKEEIIEALDTEPLATGYWVNFGGDFDGTFRKSLGECAVCAVGAIFKHKLSGDLSAYAVERHIDELMRHMGSLHDPRQAEEHAEAGRYLQAISCVFEGTAGDMDKRREVTIKFVKEEFPEKIFLDIDGFTVKGAS